MKKADWNQSNTAAQNYIQNKPTIPAAQVQSDWNAVSGLGVILNKPTIPSAMTYYNSAGTITRPTKVWTGTVTPSTGNGYSIDISSAGFTSITDYQITPIRNTNVPTSVPKVAVKSESNSAIVVNLIEGNASLVSLLGVSVLSGTSEQFATVTGLTLKVRVEGN